MTETCGTPEYIAPEILLRIPYMNKVDCWAVGVIAYILMSGIMPFDDDCRSRLYTHIITANYIYYPQFWSGSEQAKHFVDSLLGRKILKKNYKYPERKKNLQTKLNQKTEYNTVVSHRSVSRLVIPCKHVPLHQCRGGRRGPTKPKGRGHVGSRAAKNQKGVGISALSRVRQKKRL
nr:unnamed protein product [Meloidogyne enterolobii]